MMAVNDDDSGSHPPLGMNTKNVVVVEGDEFDDADDISGVEFLQTEDLDWRLHWTRQRRRTTSR